MKRKSAADPVAGALEPLGVARGVGVDEEGVVAVPAAATVPVALPAAPATTAAAGP